MGLTAEEYLRQLQALLPEGWAWTQDDDATLTAVLRGWADDHAVTDADATRVVDSAMPDGEADDLLANWERVLGVEGRDAVIAAISAQGGATPAYFIGLAERLGITVTIVDNLTGGTVGMKCNSPCNSNLHTYDKSHWWEVRVDGAGPMPGLQALFRRLKPAQTAVVFVYEDD